MTRQLTEGAVATIMHGGVIEQPVIQILGIRRIAGAADERYQLMVSDGNHLNNLVMLSTRLNDMLTSGELSDYSVVRVNHLVTNMVNLRGSREISITIILDLTILAKGTEVGAEIGSPTFFTRRGADPRAAARLIAPPHMGTLRTATLRAAALRAMMPLSAMCYRVIQNAAACPAAEMRDKIQRLLPSCTAALHTALTRALALPPAAMRAALVRAAKRIRPAWRAVARRTKSMDETELRARLLHSDTQRLAAVYGFIHKMDKMQRCPPERMRYFVMNAAELLPPGPLRAELLGAAELSPEALRAAVRHASALLAPAWHVVIPPGAVLCPIRLWRLYVCSQKQRKSVVRTVLRTAANHPPSQMRDALLSAAEWLPENYRWKFLRLAGLPPVAMRAAVMRLVHGPPRPAAARGAVVPPA